jgi:diguanylate cyclase
MEFRLLKLAAPIFRPRMDWWHCQSTLSTHVHKAAYDNSSLQILEVSLTMTNESAGQDQPCQYRRQYTTPMGSFPVTGPALMFMAIAMCSIILLGVAYLYDGYKKRFEEATKDNEHLATALAQHVDATVTQIDNLSNNILERIHHDSINQYDRRRMHSIFKDLVVEMPEIAGLFIYGKDGSWLSTDKESMPAGANNADREYFIYDQSVPNDSNIHIGSVIRSRSTGEMVLPISKRISGKNGEFNGVFLATLKTNHLNNFYSKFLDDENSVIVLALPGGEIVARVPFVETMIGKSLAQGLIFKNLLPIGSNDTVLVPSVIEHVDKLFSYRLTEDIDFLSR